MEAERIEQYNPRDLSFRGCPEGWAEAAEIAEAAGDYSRAAACWERGAGASLGHNRRGRYYAAAERCRERAADQAARA